MEKMTIGQLSKEANVNPETIRYYERRGLLPDPSKNKSGHRIYSLETLQRTKFIKRSKALGFSLKEISELLSLRVEPGATCGDIQTRVEKKIADVQKRITDLEQIKIALWRLSKACSGKGPVGQCPVLKELYR